MKKNYIVLWCAVVSILVFGITIFGYTQQKAQPVKAVVIPDGVYEPADWGRAYPTHYELWKKTEESTPAGKSKYKRGFDADRITYDKLSEFPFMALLYSGWGFGVEYNEPRGHAFMVIDQIDIDESRVKAGGVCLTCKSPYAPKLAKEMGTDYY